MCTRALALIVLACAAPAFAQQAEQPSQQPEPPVAHEEYVVVTASRADEELVNSPAAVSVISSETIKNSPGTNIGDLLRAVPGMNVTQLSARDVNVTSRAATGTLATSQLALVDGRTIYLDFFGMVMWDLVPTTPSDIKQIEVIRGPASAMWGANAMTGVVNVITKSPRELAAESKGTVTVGAGTFDRSVSGRKQDSGSLFSINGAHAQAIDEHWSYKVSAGLFAQDALPRPAGAIPNNFHTPYPPFANTGTSQPKFDGRVDYDTENNARISVSGGIAGTEGIIHTGIGPFDVERGSRLGYVSSRYTKGGRRLGFFINVLNGNAANLLAAGPTGVPIAIDFITRTIDLEAGDTLTVAQRHLLSYGGNYRRNIFDFSLAPNGKDRNEGGGYLQDEIYLTNHFRWVIGGRVDKSSSIKRAVFSPRTTLLIKPTPPHTFRLSFNRAFRAPSFINNNIDSEIINQLNLGLINPALAGVIYSFPIHAVGNTDLKQETLTAYEIGYTGIVRRRATLTAAIYWNQTDDGVYFTQTGRYGAANPPAGWPLPPVVLEALAAAGSPLPSVFSYRNFSTIKDKGIELGVDASVNRYVNAFTNYSYQWDPKGSAVALGEVNLPPNHHFNAGFNFSYRRFLGNLSANYTDEAFWQDVLDSRFHGSTDAYTLVNAAFGVQWIGGRVVTSIKLTNLANDEVMQHVFGDVLKRQVASEVRFTF